MKQYFVFVLLFVSFSFNSNALINKWGADLNSPRYEKINSEMTQLLQFPYFFMVPELATSPLPTDLVTGQKGSPLLLIQNQRSVNGNVSRIPRENQIGLRLTLVDGSNNRQNISASLGSSNLIKTGDIILSFRPEWYGSLQYSHVQLGISHAGVAYIDKYKNQTHLFNLDMPLNRDTFRDENGLNMLSAKHYREAPFLHIVRPKVLHDGVNDKIEEANVLNWSKLVASRAASIYNTQLKFNSDYSSPIYKLNEDGSQPELDFVADLARMALGIQPKSPRSMYCSEFAWVILSLRDCNPLDQTFVHELQSGKTPACISEIMTPMKVLGDLQNYVGLADGPILVVQAMTNNLERQKALLRGIIATATGKAEKISTGHIQVQNILLNINPKFFEDLLGYYQGLFTLQTLSGTDSPAADQLNQQIQFARMAFNNEFVRDESGALVKTSEGQLMTKPSDVNYSPTAFFVHALLPSKHQLKRFDYVTTIITLDRNQYSRARRAIESL